MTASRRRDAARWGSRGRNIRDSRLRPRRPSRASCNDCAKSGSPVAKAGGEVRRVRQPSPSSSPQRVRVHRQGPVGDELTAAPTRGNSKRWYWSTSAAARPSLVWSGPGRLAMWAVARGPTCHRCSPQHSVEAPSSAGPGTRPSALAGRRPAPAWVAVPADDQVADGARRSGGSRLASGPACPEGWHRPRMKASGATSMVPRSSAARWTPGPACRGARRRAGAGTGRSSRTRCQAGTLAAPPPPPPAGSG